MKLTDRLQASLSDDGRYRLLVEAIHDYAIYMLDPTASSTSWNPGAQRFKGYTAARNRRPALLAFLHRGGPASRPARARTGDGAARRQVRERRLARAQGWHPLLGLRGHRSDPRRLRRDSSAIAKITRDLTERRKCRGGAPAKRGAVPAAGAGRHRLRASTCSTATGHVSNWNAGAQRIKGYLPDEIIGQHFSRFYTDEDRADRRAAKGARHRGARGPLREGRLARPQGRHAILGACRARSDP